MPAKSSVDSILNKNTLTKDQYRQKKQCVHFIVSVFLHFNFNRAKPEVKKIKNIGIEFEIVNFFFKSSLPTLKDENQNMKLTKKN